MKFSLKSSKRLDDMKAEEGSTKLDKCHVNSNSKTTAEKMHICIEKRFILKKPWV